MLRKIDIAYLIYFSLSMNICIICFVCTDTLNTQVHESIKKMPYEVVFGQPPRSTIVPDAHLKGKIDKDDLGDADDSSNDTFSQTKGSPTKVKNRRGNPQKKELCEGKHIGDYKQGDEYVKSKYWCKLSQQEINKESLIKVNEKKCIIVDKKCEEYQDYSDKDFILEKESEKNQAYSDKNIMSKKNVKKVRPFLMNAMKRSCINLIKKGRMRVVMCTSVILMKRDRIKLVKRSIVNLIQKGRIKVKF